MILRNCHSLILVLGFFTLAIHETKVFYVWKKYWIILHFKLEEKSC